jgi:anaerobic magnesium-protoporphyrin IX monomethyl ester cyclase
MDFLEYESTLRQMGIHSGAYRDLNLNFIRCNNRPYPISEIYNTLYRSNMNPGSEFQPIGVGESFSAAIAYLGTYLHRRGYSFDYVNSFREQKDELAEILQTCRVLSVAIPTTLYVSVFPIVEILRFVRQHNPGARIIIGGPFVSTQIRSQEPNALEYLFKTTLGADIYVHSSQGEATLVSLLQVLKQGGSLAAVPNIFYKTGNGSHDEYRSTPVQQEANQLEENMVDWSLFAPRVGQYVNIRTAISCPFSCNFCGFPQRAGTYQTASVQAVEKELKELAKIKTVSCVHFIDDTFNIPPQRFKDLLGRMIKNRFTFKWHSYFRCQYADPETVQLMKASGCEGVFLGLESGNDSILENMNKNTRISQYLKGIELLKNQGITTFGNFILGFPGETQETVQDTVDFLEKSELDFYRIQLWYCEPVTPIWKQKEKYRLEGESFTWRHQTMDSTEACNLIEEIFLAPRKSIWVPQYNFDFDGFWHLVHRGMSVPQAGDFLRNFNHGVREKLTAPDPQEIETGYEIIKQLNTSCKGEDYDRYPVSVPLDLQADFDF